MLAALHMQSIIDAKRYRHRCVHSAGIVSVLLDVRQVNRVNNQSSAEETVVERPGTADDTCLDVRYSAAGCRPAACRVSVLMTSEGSNHRRRWRLAPG